MASSAAADADQQQARQCHRHEQQLFLFCPSLSPAFLKKKLRQEPTVVLGHVPVAGDGNCLFHALGYLDARGGATLRNAVAAFMVENAADQIGFENAWLEEADELLQGTWGGHTAITAYSLMHQVRVQIHTLQASGAVVVTDASHASVSGNTTAPLRRILYSNNNHYDALVELLQNPQGWVPAWPQAGVPVYYKERDVAQPAKPKKNAPKAAPTPGSNNSNNNRKPPRQRSGNFGGQPVKKKSATKKSSPDDKAPPSQDATGPAKAHPVPRRCSAKSAPPPELRDDILTELARLPVKARMAHPHRRQEQLIKDGVAAFSFPVKLTKIHTALHLINQARLKPSHCHAPHRNLRQTSCACTQRFLPTTRLQRWTAVSSGPVPSAPLPAALGVKWTARRDSCMNTSTPRTQPSWRQSLHTCSVGTPRTPSSAFTMKPLLPSVALRPRLPAALWIAKL
jgi:hypothetical protein